MKAKITLDLSELGLEQPLPPVETANDVPDKAEIDTSNFGVPISLSLMLQPVHCQGCGQEHFEHQGLCLELKFPAHRAFRKLDQWERAAYDMLPRRLEYMPMTTLDFCRDCFAIGELLNFVSTPPEPQMELPLTEPKVAVAMGRSIVKPDGRRLPAVQKPKIAVDVSDLEDE